jgi:hypothetical protein
MLRNVSRKALVHLTHLFNHLLGLGYFPSTWKKAKVMPIPKPHKPSTDPNSYRPVSLLSTLGKLFERVIAVRLTSFVNQQRLLPHAQFGFRRKHSTVAQLARITDYVSNGYNLQKHTGMVLLDLEKAYDTVWIYGLYKLINYKLPTSSSVSPQSVPGGTLLHSSSERGTLLLQNYPLWPSPSSGIIDYPLCPIYISDMPLPFQYTTGVIRR